MERLMANQTPLAIRKSILDHLASTTDQAKKAAEEESDKKRWQACEDANVVLANAPQFGAEETCRCLTVLLDELRKLTPGIDEDLLDEWRKNCVVQPISAYAVQILAGALRGEKEKAITADLKRAERTFGAGVLARVADLACRYVSAQWGKTKTGTERRPAYDRDHAFLQWSKMGMKKAEIRDKWNKENPGAFIGDGRQGLDTVLTGLKKAKSEQST
jgi:hypothetical protein